MPRRYVELGGERAGASISVTPQHIWPATQPAKGTFGFTYLSTITTVAIMASMITFAADNEFFRKRKREQMAAPCAVNLSLLTLKRRRCPPRMRSVQEAPGRADLVMHPKCGGSNGS